MAEFVEAGTEKTIENLDSFRHISLLSEAEARNVIKSRQTYEYRLARHTKRKTDYTNYIQFEINFLEMIRMRRKKLRCFTHKHLDFELLNRIHSLFRSVVMRFQNDVDLWMLHIDFAKNHRQAAYAGRLYKRMLQVHSQRTDLWLSAINWELEMKQPDAARKLFLTALRFNREDETLWLAYQRFELQRCVTAKHELAEIKKEAAKDKESKEGEEIEEPKIEFPEAVVDGRLAVLAFRKAVEATPKNRQLWVKLFDAWREDADNELATQHSEELFNLVKIDDSPELVAAWCRRAMIGVLPGCQLEAVQETIARFDDKIKQKADLASSGVFRSLEIKFILEQINKVAPKSKNTPSEDRSHFLSKIKHLVQSANDLKIQLSEQVLVESIDLLDAENSRLSKRIVQSAVSAYPASKRLWLALFDTLCAEAKSTKESTSNEPLFVKSVTESFAASFPDTITGHEDAKTVWHASLQLCILLRLKTDRFDEVWQQAASLHLQELGSSYLNWAYHSCALAKSPWKAAERAFTRITGPSVKRPLPLELHLTRLKLAMSTADSSLRYGEVEEMASFCEVQPSAVRRIFDDVLLDVGTNRLELWLMWVQFESAYGDLESLTHIAWRARHVLTANALTEFNATYTEITASSSSAQLPTHVVSKMRKTSK